MRRLAVIGALLLLATTAPTAQAAHPSWVRADLDGRPTPTDRIADHYCHDRDFPVIHCYSTPIALQESLAAASAADLAVAPKQSTSDYVVVYSGLANSGSYMFISQNYDALAIVGWNDRIRSYRVLNGRAGTFYTDWFGSGAVLQFCCGAAVTSLSSTFDAQISSVYQR